MANRRRFLETVAAAGAFTGALARRLAAQAESAGVLEGRLDKAHAYRLARAERLRAAGPVEHVTNGDEQRYATRINSFSKTLLHDQFGHVSRDAYASLIRATNSGRKEDFERIIRGGTVRLKNPTGAYNYQLAGLDQSQFTLRPPPAFDSAAQAAAMVELYWMALCRDIPYAAWDTDLTVAAACRELTALPAYSGPRIGGRVTPACVFRGHTPGDLVGPYLSQFLLAPFRMGHLAVDQKQVSARPGVDFMTGYGDYLQIQFGEGKGPGDRLDTVPRYVRTGRDLAHLVYVDWSFSPHYHALWHLLGYGAEAYTESNPYTGARGQEPYINFGPPDSFEYVARAAKPAFNAAWFQKWMVHRQARPEAMGCRMHNHTQQVQLYPIHETLLNSAGAEAVNRRFGGYLLPQGYSPGSPAHSTYPSGHATVAGAVVTMLKALFRESFVLPSPVVASADGSELAPWRGADLTVGGELNKLAFNIAVGRNWAGIHYRYDAWEGMRLGERVAVAILEDMLAGYMDEFAGLSFTGFDGNRITVGANGSA
jgi:hypothetical protein